MKIEKQVVTGLVSENYSVSKKIRRAQITDSSPQSLGILFVDCSMLHLQKFVLHNLCDLFTYILEHFCLNVLTFFKPDEDPINCTP